MILWINFTTSKTYGETEFWLSLIKVLAIIAFIIIGLLILLNVLPTDKASLLESPFVSLLDSVGIPYAGDIRTS